MDSCIEADREFIDMFLGAVFRIEQGNLSAGALRDREQVIGD
jgi:hypothetical protein